MNNFLKDVLNGLQSTHKYLDSKYFYDKNGDEIFQKIMSTDDYYLTNCEQEILSKQNTEIADSISNKNEDLNIIEFGVGDATKSIYLLKKLYKKNPTANYYPIDISKNIIELLNKKIPKQIPGLKINGLNGEYFEMLREVNKISKKKKLILFLGANIGNFKFDTMSMFCKKLRSLLSAGDMVLIGFDLKKNPITILAAYNDSEGFTRQFNLNLLLRINNELGANFDLNKFEHYAMYDPDTGACKSYLVSEENLVVNINGVEINFTKGETIFTEISQKYTVNQIDEIAAQCGFSTDRYFFDSKKYFADVIWKCE